MADGRLAKFRDFPIRMYVDAILERDPGKCLLYKSVYDNDSESQANQRSMSNHVVPVETNAPESSEVEKAGQEIVVYQEPIEHSDDCETSSQNDTDSDFEISEDSDDELQDDAAVFEVETVKEHVTTSKRISVQPAKASELEIPKVNETGVKTDKDYDTSRTISDIPTRLGNVSRCPNDGSVDGGVNNNENNVPVDDANSGKRVNQIKEKKRVLLTQIKKYLEGSKNKSDKPCVPKVNSRKRCGSKARRTIDVEDDDDDFPSRKRKANNIDLNKKAKEINFKKPRFDEAETSKSGASRRKPVVVLALEENKQKSRANKDDSFINAEKVDKSLCLADGEIGAHKTKEPVFCGLLRGSVPSGSEKMQKVVKADDLQINVMKPLKRGAKDDVDENDRLVSATKLPKALHLADDNSAAGKCKASGTFGGFKPLGEAIKKNPVKSDELRLDVAKLLYRGPEKLKSKAEENDRFASDRETGRDKSSYGFGGLLRFEPSGSLAVAGQAKKQKGVQAKNIGADKGKASGLLRVLEPSGSRSGLGRVDEVKEQKAAAKAIEPWVDLVKETNNGPKWHAKCKESGVCSWLGKYGPSSS